MLDKLKLFKPPPEKPPVSKHASSSSGYSSGRSEQSDSSAASTQGNVSTPLTTLAVFDQPATPKKIVSQPSAPSSSTGGTKERGTSKLKGKTSSPKLNSPKLKRPTEEMKSEIKPLAVGTGIPKPTAAVKGTAKVVVMKKEKEKQARETIHRTPGDGKDDKDTAGSSREESEPATEPPKSTKPGRDNNVALVSPMPSTVEEKLAEEKKTKAEEDEEDDVVMNVQPMMPLHIPTLVMKTNYSSDSEAASGGAGPASGVGNGPKKVGSAYVDPLDGYLSEGGASLYARRMHYLAVTNSRNKEDDSFDDSSSLSSGVSDPWNELYGVQSKMEPSSVYPGYGTPLQSRRHPPQSIESSPYKQISSSQWKKFIEAGRLPSAERIPTDLWKERSRDPRLQRMNSSEAPQEASPRAILDNETARKSEKKLNTALPDAKRRTQNEALSPYGSTAKPTLTDSRRQQPVKGVPTSFGYVKKGSHPASPSVESKRSELANGRAMAYKTAQVATIPKLDSSADAPPVPRTVGNPTQSLERPKTKLKVSGGTQTDMGEGRILTAKTTPAPKMNPPTGHYASYSDSEYQSSPGVVRLNLSSSPKPAAVPQNFKSYSLTTPLANQLSQNIRERLMLSGTQSLPKSHLAHLKNAAAEEKRNYAAHLFAGVSDFAGSNGDIDLNIDSKYTKNSPLDKLRDKDKFIKYVASSRASTDGSLSDTPYTTYWNKYANTRQPPDLMSNPESVDSVPMQGPKGMWQNNPPSPRLNRSNSVRSTKSEKLYPSMLQRNEEGELEMDPNTNLPVRYASSSPSGPGSVSRSSLGNYSALLSLSRMGSKEDDCHGSSLSLVSTASSLYSTQEEKQASEIRKLRRELAEAQEKINTLSGQLCTNGHVVAAFEQSLSSMTSRLQTLTITAEQKESELQELRQIMDRLRSQGIEAGLVSSGTASAAAAGVASSHGGNSSSQPAGAIVRQLSSDSVSSMASQMTTMSSASSPSASQAPPPSPSPSPSPSMKKKSWLRSSFSKAFSRSKRGQRGAGSDSEDSSGTAHWSAPSSPLLAAHHSHNTSQPEEPTPPTPEVVENLKRQLREKDMVLTDIRLEALSSAHQLEALKETVSRMKNEMMNLRQDNERLQRIVTEQSEGSAQSSAQNSIDRKLTNKANIVEFCPVTSDLLLGLTVEKDSKVIALILHAVDCETVSAVVEADAKSSSWSVGYVGVSGKTRWENLDECIKCIFNEYLAHIDPKTKLGLDETAIWYYRVGEVSRIFLECDSLNVPELLPCGYLVGDCNQIHLYLKSARNSASLVALSIDTLIPLPVLNRYASLLMENRRMILCGPSGTGKSHLAKKLAEFLVAKANKGSNCIVTFRVDAATCKEVRHYLSHLIELTSASVEPAGDLPEVIILEDLHLAPSLSDVFAPLSQVDQNQCTANYPFIIGTTGPMTTSATNLQLQYNFRWVLLANHLEPVQGLLTRCLRRRLVDKELKSRARDQELHRITEWIPKCWVQLNKFLESHNSADVTIGPRWFFSVPCDATCSQVWFTDLWNYTLGPYLLHAAREGLQLYGKRAAWEDPAQWVMSTYPWNSAYAAADALMRLRPEDVGYDTATRPRSLNRPEPENDPLLNMLAKLQEAVGLPSPVENSEHSSESQNDNSESAAHEA